MRPSSEWDNFLSILLKTSLSFFRSVIPFLASPPTVVSPIHTCEIPTRCFRYTVFNITIGRRVRVSDAVAGAGRRGEAREG